MPRIKVRFILESSNKNRYLGVKHAVSVSPSLGTAAKRRSKTSKRSYAASRLSAQPLQLVPCVSFAGYADKRE